MRTDSDAARGIFIEFSRNTSPAFVGSRWTANPGNNKKLARDLRNRHRVCCPGLARGFYRAATSLRPHDPHLEISLINQILQGEANKLLAERPRIFANRAARSGLTTLRPFSISQRCEEMPNFLAKGLRDFLTHAERIPRGYKLRDRPAASSGCAFRIVAADLVPRGAIWPFCESARRCNTLRLLRRFAFQFRKLASQKQRRAGSLGFPGQIWAKTASWLRQNRVCCRKGFREVGQKSPSSFLIRTSS